MIPGFRPGFLDFAFSPSFALSQFHPGPLGFADSAREMR
jgi:hypothetical protein